MLYSSEKLHSELSIRKPRALIFGIVQINMSKLSGPTSL
jgi:hypothetical protein